MTTFSQSRLTLIGWALALIGVATLPALAFAPLLSVKLAAGVVGASAVALIALGLGVETIEVMDGLLTGRRSNVLSLGPVAVADVAEVKQLPRKECETCIRTFLRSRMGVSQVSVRMTSGETIQIATRAPKRLLAALTGSLPAPLFRKLWTDYPSSREGIDAIGDATRTTRASFVML